MMPTVRRPGRLVLAAAAGVLVVAGSAGATDDPGDGLSSYALRANAPGLGLEGLYRDVAVTVPETTSSLTTGGVGAGLASLAWPGPIAGNLGDTILVLQPSAPSQVQSLNDPVRAETRSGGKQEATDTSIPGTLMTSRALPDLVTARSEMGVSTLPNAGFGAFKGASSVHLTGPTAAVATAESTVQDLSLAGGQVTIGSARSTATVTVDGGHATTRGGTTVTGMTVGGVPVTVDGSGLHVAGQTVGNPVPQQTVDDAVKALGLTVLLTRPRTTVQSGSAAYDAGALVLVLTQGGKDYSLTLGRASASVDTNAGATGGTTSTGEVPLAPPPASSGGPFLGGGTGGSAALTAGGSGQALPPTVSSPAGPALAGLPGPVAAALAPVAYALAGGPPVALVLGALLAAVLAGAALRRLPDRVLTLPAAQCDERLS
jgi:hypothetical protein